MINSHDFTGTLITFEGIEGAGKSTNIKFLANYLESFGLEVVVTREPGGTKLGEKIRTLLLDTTNQNIDIKTELLLMYATRAQHVAEVVIPALKAGKIVVSDRYYDASFAYQGGGRGISLDKINTLTFEVLQLPTPDITFLFDISISASQKRLNLRQHQDRIEQEQQDFFNRVRQTYLELANQHPQRIKVINGELDITSVQTQITEIVSQKLNLAR